jgi:hypothetical protein
LSNDVVGYSQSGNDTRGWLFRVIDPNVPSPRYFVTGSPVVEEARQLLIAHPDVGDDKVEAVGPVSASNMLEFEVGAGEVKEIDAPYP